MTIKKDPPFKTLQGDDKPKKPRQKLNFPKYSRWQRIRGVVGVLAGLGAAAFVFGFLVLLFYSSSLPDIDKLTEGHSKTSITILDSRGNFLASYGDSYTEYVKYADLPKTLVDAVIATEDRRFFDHWGVDIRGLARAVVVNLAKGRLAQGGSTVTQQLAKITFLKPDRNLKRKIQEAILAVWIERKYKKEEIMEMYLNSVYLGSGVYGVDAAARKYFKKSAKRLNLYESAMIAGMLKAPTSYSPINNLKASVSRTEQVLENMVDAEKITDKQMRKAYRQGAELKFERVRDSDKYFTDYVVDLIPEYMAKAPDKIIVKTTFNPTYQKFAEDAVTKNMLEYGDNMRASQASVVAMKPDGAVVAMIGGVDYSLSQYNRAVQAQRQPGSLFKLFIYMSALENGFMPDTIIEDAPVVVDGWKPENFDGQYHGVITLKDAFVHSYNAAAVNVAEMTGRRNVLDMARRMGIRSPMATTPSVVLGASEVNLLEMTGAYATVANNGFANEPYAIEVIKTTKGEKLYEHKKNSWQAASQQTVNMMNQLLTGVISGGTGRGAAISRQAGGKTGTSQDFRDAWFVGFTPSIVAGVWVGNDDNKSMKKVTGGSIPARIWRDFMASAVQNTPEGFLPMGSLENLDDRPWDSSTGQVPTSNGLPEQQVEQQQPAEQVEQAPVEAEPQPQPQTDSEGADSFWQNLNTENTNAAQ